MKIKDNRAFLVRCYDPVYTFVEKLQTIVTKFRIQQETGLIPANFIRHYYDVFCLLQMAKQEAFLLNDSETRKLFEREYQKSTALYYQGQPTFKEILSLIANNLDSL